MVLKAHALKCRELQWNFRCVNRALPMLFANFNITFFNSLVAVSKNLTARRTVYVTITVLHDLKHVRSILTVLIKTTKSPRPVGKKR